MIDSSGIGELIAQRGVILDTDNGFYISGLQGRVQADIKTTGLHTVFDIRPNREGAVESLKGKPVAPVLAAH